MLGTAFMLITFTASAAGDLAAAANRIIDSAMAGREAYAVLQELTDTIGHRLSGSPQAAKAVEWGAAALRARGIEHVRQEAIMVPHWVRGEASFAMVAPAAHDLVGLALGGSIATPPDGIVAPVIEVLSFEQLAALGDLVKGKIVLFNRPMPDLPEKFMAYGAAVPQRAKGAIEAAKLGAVAALVRSVGTASYRLPHTGAMQYADQVPKIPAAALTAEDADLIHRLLEKGHDVRVRMRMTCELLPDVPSANVVADWPGKDRPDEVVLIGGHLDSWDVGAGAIDDGAGVAVCIETLRLFKALDLRPHRTIRAVLFMNEENGLRGGKGYAEQHRNELAKHVAAIESDSGAARPIGFGVTAGKGGIEQVSEWVPLFAPLGKLDLRDSGGGADIGPMRAAGVPMIALRQDGTHYFDFHHTPADTLDKVDPRELELNAAALAVMAYALADSEQPLPRVPPAAASDD
ncbi:MAG: M20/M25/M40 family metallo-hydrolase [Planctomycetota bacterium]